MTDIRRDFLCMELGRKVCRAISGTDINLFQFGHLLLSSLSLPLFLFFFFLFLKNNLIGGSSPSPYELEEVKKNQTGRLGLGEKENS